MRVTDGLGAEAYDRVYSDSQLIRRSAIYFRPYRMIVAIVAFVVVLISVAATITPILIVDDSTSAIDSTTEDQIQRAMRRILTGRTTLLITHRLAQIMRADRILVLKQGELIAQGSHVELLESSPLYRQLFIPSERIAPNNGKHLEWSPVTATQHNQELE